VSSAVGVLFEQVVDVRQIILDLIGVSMQAQDLSWMEARRARV
jgi:hypothetical protein